MNSLFIVFIILILLTALALIGIVLIQKSKGGGLASSFAGANQVMGVRQTNSVVERATWWLIGLMWLFCVCATFTMPRTQSNAGIRVQDAPAQQVPAGNFDTNAPAAPAAPAAQTPAAPAGESK